MEHKTRIASHTHFKIKLYKITHDMRNHNNQATEKPNHQTNHIFEWLLVLHEVATHHDHITLENKVLHSRCIVQQHEMNESQITHNNQTDHHQTPTRDMNYTQIIRTKTTHMRREVSFLYRTTNDTGISFNRFSITVDRFFFNDHSPWWKTVDATHAIIHCFPMPSVGMAGR